jgi:hypothetical protein
MMVPLLLLAIIFGFKSARVNYILAAVLLIILPRNSISTIKLIKERKKEFIHRNEFAEFEASLLEIPKHIQSESTVVLWCYNEYDFGNCTEALLPFSTSANKPIMYTTSVVSPVAPPEEKFKQYGKLKIDYILSRYALPWSSLKPVHSTPYYYLYQITSDQGTLIKSHISQGKRF